MNEAQKQAKERAEVMLAFANGKKIEWLNGNKWDEISSPGWAWGDYDYRVKREPQVVLVFRKKGEERWCVRHPAGTREKTEKDFLADCARLGKVEEYEYRILQIPE